MFDQEKKLIVVILRGIVKKDISPIAEICIRNGIEHLEITMNTKDAPVLIHEMIKASKSKMYIGAGTVLNHNDLESALGAGAEFIVSPCVEERVISECVASGIPILPGVLTPTEIAQVINLGVSSVKLFPASAFGPSYIKELKGPYDNLKVVAVGGVNETNVSEYYKHGADGFAIGGNVFKKEWLQANRYDLIEEKLVKVLNASKS